MSALHLLRRPVPAPYFCPLFLIFQISLFPILRIVQKIHENYCCGLHLSIGQLCWLNEPSFKRYSQKCTLSHVLMYSSGCHRFGKSWDHLKYKNQRHVMKVGTPQNFYLALIDELEKQLFNKKNCWSGPI